HMAPGPGCTLGWCPSHGTAPDPAAAAPGVPGLGVPSTMTPHREAYRACTTRATRQPRTPTTCPVGCRDHGQHAIGHGIRPATAVPLTVLVAEMLNGSLLLHGWRDGPTAYLCPEDAAPLKRELATAFGSPELILRADDGVAP